MSHEPTPPPPHSAEVEQHVLQVLVQNPKMMVYAEEVLDAECFYVGNHQIIFECLAQAYSDGGRGGFVALIQALVAGGHPKDAQKLALSLKNGYASEIDFMGDINLLALLNTQRKLLTQSMQITRAIYTKEGMETITSYASGMAGIVTGQNRQIQKMHLSDSIDELCAQLDKPRIGGLSGVNTGLGLINGQTDGWHSSDVVVLAGRPGMGKTVAAIYHAYHAALAGIPTAYISLEMPKTGITSRT